MDNRIRLTALAGVLACAASGLALITLPGPDFDDPEVREQWVAECEAWHDDPANGFDDYGEDFIEIQCWNALLNQTSRPDWCPETDYKYASCLDGP